MRRHREIFNPITMTKEMKTKFFTKYVEIRKEQEKENRPTKPELLREIETQFYDSHKNCSKEDLDEVWSFVWELVLRNEGLAIFILDFDGAKSDFFFPWLIQVASSPSAALEMSYGFGYDIAGNWREVNKDDPIYFFVANDPTFVYNRERQLNVADLVSSVRDIRHYGDRVKVVDLGAGRLAWARWHGFTLTPSTMSIYAFDRDPSIDPDKLFKQGAKKNEIRYYTMDLFSALESTICQESDLIILGGVASYFPMKVFEEKIVKKVYTLLKDNGTFFFDLQLDCPYYRRSVAIFSWPELQLVPAKESVSAEQVAIALLEQMRRRLWETGMRFGVEYKPDTYNKSPTSIMVTLTKT